jgi:hypothetical protein
LYLEGRPAIIVNQSKFLRDSCVCGCSYCLVLIVGVDEPDSIESRETAIPSNHDMGLSQLIPCHHLMDCEVRDAIVQLLEQNSFMKNYGPKRIMSELHRHNVSKNLIPSRIQIQNMISYHHKSSLISTMKFIQFRISCGSLSILEMRHQTRLLFLSMM